MVLSKKVLVIPMKVGIQETYDINQFTIFMLHRVQDSALNCDFLLVLIKTPDQVRGDSGEPDEVFAGSAVGQADALLHQVPAGVIPVQAF